MATLAILFLLGFAGTYGVTNIVDDVSEGSLQQRYSQLKEEFDQLEEESDRLIADNAGLNEALRLCNGHIEDDTVCEAGFVGLQGKCYWFNMERLGWNKAQVACIRKGATLASIKSEEEQAFLEHQASTNFGTEGRRMDYYWIGMTTARDDSLVWWDGSPVVYDNFGTGEPQCMHFNCKVAMSETVGYRWEDVTNSLEYFSICKKDSTIR